MKTYVVTSAQYDAKPNKQFLDSLDTYCSHNSAEVLVIPVAGATASEETLDDRILEYEQVQGNKKLNSNVKISAYEIRPQQIDPTTGLARFAQNDASTIFGSTKQRLKVVPNSNTKLPKILVTTGAVTHPNYANNRVGRIAEKDHTYGAVIVEVIDNALYHLRHISAQKNGKFYDLARLYDGKKEPRQVQPEALILGDWHTGDTDKTVREQTSKMFKEMMPKRVFVHDIFNGHSINHHEEGRAIDLYNNKHRLNLEEEVRNVGKELEWMANESNAEVYVVKSNHDEWLHQYLNEGRFINDTQNLKLAAETLVDVLNGKDALESAIENVYGAIDGVKFLKRDDDYKIRGWQLANHGDHGANGARGSIRTIEAANGKSIVGHRHTPEIFRDVVIVGTSTKLKLSYTKGYSGWMNSHCLLYDNGRPQMINIIRGRYSG